jgi:hypothetical protein
MTQQTINVGTVAGDNTGDPGRTAFQKINSNFSELYNGIGGSVLLSSVSGTNTITATSTTYSSYFAGSTIAFVASGANTGAVTLNINGLGAKAITKQGSTALTQGDIKSGQIVMATYDGTRFQLIPSKINPVVSVTDFGAAGDGVTDDTAAFTAATATAQPIYVPQSTSFYSLTALTSAQQKLLYGPGVVKVSGTQVQISIAPYVNNDTANLRVYNQDLQPSKWASVQGSLYNGASSINVKRTGGYGSYGLSLTDYLISAAIPATQFDVGVTSWVTAQNFSASGAQIFGAWFGANTPSSSLSQTFTGGAAIGCEINVGNRWADFGLQSDIGGTRYTVGLQVVPDVLPASDGSTAAIYPGSFGILIAPSITGHKWWVGSLVRTDTIVPNGIAYQVNGGSTAPNATGALIKANGYFVRGLDFNNATISSQAILFAASQQVSWGGSVISGTATTWSASTGTGTGEGGLYCNNYAQLALRWSSSGSAPQLGFFGAAVTGKPTVTGSKGANAALTSLMTALSNLGLVTDSTT